MRRPGSCASSLLLPNGVQTQNLEVPGNWETSNNIGLMVTDRATIEIVCTITSAVTSRKHAVLDQIVLLADLAGEGVSAEQIGLDAPEFPWNPHSRMLEIARQSYERVMGRAPDVLVSVCSLELGMFTQRIDGLDTIGIGTDLYDLHSPKESMDHVRCPRVAADQGRDEASRSLNAGHRDRWPHRQRECSAYAPTGTGGANLSVNSGEMPLVIGTLPPGAG